ncbi:MAG TPA: thymidine phosphorylase [Pilimelia sp.]|nr:thymidine phosphorylase [Pilimelia sp.]
MTAPPPPAGRPPAGPAPRPVEGAGLGVRQWSAVEVIRAKRDGAALTDGQIDWVVAAYTRGEVAEEQMAALAMAILLRGMTPAETARWTSAMIASGERLDLTGIGRPCVDKHSTGGVGDKITLPLAPLVAACGAAVPQLAGRGLGHTGGTLDKLASIPGWRPDLTVAQLRARLAATGAVVCAAGPGLAPADRKLYALRDVTGTVESIPLIASSIMSKKLAGGAGALVLDVKVGTGAFMKTESDARTLAGAMVALGAAHGVPTVALLTEMSTPLGRAVGNAVEVTEAVEVLSGGGPPDVVELTLALAGEMLALAGLPDADPAAALADGRAMDVWRAMVRGQGGDPDAPLPTAREAHTVRAEGDGVVTAVDAYGIGLAAWRLGAGRTRREDPVSPGAGILLHRRPGERVRAGDPLYELRTDDAARLPAALADAAAAVRVAADNVRVTGDAVRVAADDAAAPPRGGHRALVLDRIAGTD